MLTVNVARVKTLRIWCVLQEESRVLHQGARMNGPSYPQVTGMNSLNNARVVPRRGIRPAALVILVLVVATCLASTAAYSQDYEAARKRLTIEISQDVRDTSGYIGKSSLDERVMQVVQEMMTPQRIPKRSMAQDTRQRR